MNLLVRLLIAIVAIFGLIGSAVAADPILKPLDKVRVNCEEEPSLNRDYIITNDGFLLMNFIGAVKVSGLNEKEAGQKIADELVRQRILTKATVSVKLVSAGTSAVSFRGAVKNFGEIPWRKGLRLSDVVAIAEPTNLADLTKVLIVAADGQRSEINFKLYDGKSNNYNPELRPGDDITFARATQSETIFVLGEVSRPGSVEFTKGMKVSDAIRLAGGLTLKASDEFRIDRKGSKSQNYSLRTDSGMTLLAGDTVFIGAIPSTNTVYVIGGVKNPGLVSFEPRMTITRAIERAGGLAEGVKLGKVKVVRLVNGKAKSVSIDMAKVQQGLLGDYELQSGDRVEVPRPGRRSNDGLLRTLGIIIGIFLLGG